MAINKVHEERYTNFGGINRKASRYITGKNQAITLVNLDLSRTGSLTKVPGSTQMVGATLTGRIGGFYEYEKLSGASYLVVGANTNAYVISGNSFNAIRSSLSNNAVLDFVTFVDWLFVSNGAQLFKFDGSNSRGFGLPPGSSLLANLGASFGGAGLSGALVYSYGYLNERGYYGPAIVNSFVPSPGATQITLSGFTTPSDYGITSIIIYRGFSGGSLFNIGSLPAGGATFIDTNLSLGSILAPDYLWVTTAPQSMELYNNQLFIGGFSNAPSSFYWSEIGEPEAIIDEEQEIRTNDGDYLSCMKAALSQLAIFKTKSLHVLSGEDPDNFSVREVTDQYGCLSKRAAAVWEQRLWFLDIKGIAEFDGANTKIVSSLVEEYFQGMNIEVAKDAAWMVHVKERNEVWTGIPANGASFINTVLVYDYVGDGWWVRDHTRMCSPAVFKGSFTRPMLGFGDFSGTIHYYDSSLYSDNGAGFTCQVKFGYAYGDAHSNQRVFRRLWLDLDPSLGGTKAITCNLYTDQGSTPALTRTLYQSEFQSRIDFGLSAKDCSPEFLFSEDSPLRLNGYTLAHRFQRDV